MDIEIEVPKTLDDIYDVLVQIRDGLISTKDAVVAQDLKPIGVQLGGTEDAGEPHGVSGQSIPEGLLDNVHLPGRTAQVRSV